MSGSKGTAMGRHSRSSVTARHAADPGPGAAHYVGRVGALAVALGIGVAVASGGGVAHAEDGATDGSPAGGQTQSSTTSSGGDAISGAHVAVDSPTTSVEESGNAGTTSTKPTKHSPVSIVGGTKTITGTSSTSATGTRDTTKPAADQPAAVATTISGSPAAATVSSKSSHTGDAPPAPAPVALGALQLVRRDLEAASLVKPAAAVTGTIEPAAAAQPTLVAAPSPTDVAHTAYGDIGTWLLQPNGQIANYGGVPHDGKTVLEPVNVIIVDPSSTSTAESVARLDAAMTRAGFPAQPIHSSGFQGVIEGTTYGQQPAGFLQAFSDNFFLFPNDHGRVFGPAPATTGAGYVYSGAFSTEALNPANPFTHQYVSSTTARDELARRLVASGAATVIGVVPLGNAYDDGTFTTGDHDGYAVVLQLTPGVVAVLPTGGVLGAACGHVDDLPGPVARQFATGLCVFAASVSNAFGLRSII